MFEFILTFNVKIHVNQCFDPYVRKYNRPNNVSHKTKKGLLNAFRSNNTKEIKKSKEYVRTNK